ncbi:uncharacterized protein TOT_020000745 [Theileria orientalis strain Shintoku]|uniref:PITH domain-containing protein n=1 Tax=Theileria orientalis strain Shintoku TaxID=869250 RepID=J4DPD0_THEOR|nr:uncharacterized protein TOT_020000745 [Theileria orientalis strain Shintoku]PVC51239.1 hypothetical protein MACL_00001688 [Theileria orientalis]BAM40489.1 uncharacterized protein TOT_020000745 [Theileria orientalis strain Shintoku]|eukprot:XP_009690790.1 uncharacterized protein TOT_020000745 [Theileria orientalis strain Shintoku]
MHSSGCGCKAEHELASSFICLREYLNISSIRVLNSTSDPNSGGLIFKKYGERLSDFHVISDDVETELLFTVPFSQPCDVHNLLVVNESDSVLKVKIYANRPEFDFSDIDTTTPSLKLDLPPDWHGSFVHSLGSRQFRGVDNLAIHFLSNEGEVKLRYIGLRGRPLNVSTGVVDVTYEVTPAPNPSENLAELRGFRVIE